MKNPTRHSWPTLVATAFAFAALAFGSSQASALTNKDRPPNVVFIYGDDIGYGDFACYGGTGAQTPNIDRLAREGLRFVNGYCSSATCTPSRYSLLTGEYAFRKPGTGVLPGDAAMVIEPGRTTVATLMQRAGYKTAAIGKWHLGLGDGRNKIEWNGDIKPGPREIGFDYTFIMAATGDRVPCVYMENSRIYGLSKEDPLLVSYNDPFPGELNGIKDREKLKLDWSHGHNMAVHNGVGRIGFQKGGKSAQWVDEDMADVFVGKALSFIEREKKNRFFLYFATHDIHVPRMPNPRFAGKTSMGTRGDVIVEFDWCVGEIVRKLEELKLTEETLIILSSDNGPVLDDGYKDMANEKLGDHKPAGVLRGGKYSLFEGGTRVPFIVRWPGRVKPGVSQALVSQVDFSATLGALVGQKPDARTMPDTQNVLPALLGDSPTGRDHIVEHAGRLGLRVGRWKYVSPGPVREKLGPWISTQVPQPGFLFDLETDPGETKDLAAQHPERVKEMAARLATFKVAENPAAKGGKGAKKKKVD